MARVMLETLEMHRETSFQYLFTGDETWMFYAYHHKTQWVASWEEIEEVQRPTHHQKRRVFTVFFNGTGQCFTDYLPEDVKMNSTYYCRQVITPLYEACERDGMVGGQPPLTLHFDNAPIHTAQETKTVWRLMGWRECPTPYSPDLAPCDFFLFGYLKGALSGQQFTELPDISVAVQEILNGIPRDMLEWVFAEWADRLQRCVETGGEYVE
jgi:hypothetical protein